MRFYSVVRSASWFVTGYPAASYSRFLAISELWSREQLEIYRNEKIKTLLAHCYENVPYYRHVMDEHKIKPDDIQHVGDLTKLPVLTRDTLRAHAKELLAKNFTNMKTMLSKTG